MIQRIWMRHLPPVKLLLLVEVVTWRCHHPFHLLCEKLVPVLFFRLFLKTLDVGCHFANGPTLEALLQRKRQSKRFFLLNDDVRFILVEDDVVGVLAMDPWKSKIHPDQTIFTFYLGPGSIFKDIAFGCTLALLRGSWCLEHGLHLHNVD